MNTKGNKTEKVADKRCVLKVKGVLISHLDFTRTEWRYSSVHS